jgi:cell division protein FtsX
VKSIKFVSRDDAFRQMKKRNPSLTRHVKKNPLPDALVMTANSGDGKTIADALKPYPPGVEYVRYSER